MFSPVLFSQEVKGGKEPSKSPRVEISQVFEDRVEVKREVIEESIPFYRARLREILKQAEENIKRVDKEIADRAIMARNDSPPIRNSSFNKSFNGLFL